MQRVGGLADPAPARAQARDNLAARMKHADAPERFMDTEVDLDDAVRQLQAVASAPELYPELVRLGAVPGLLGLLGHENGDLAASVAELLRELTDADAVEDSARPPPALQPAETPSCVLPVSVRRQWVARVCPCLLLGPRGKAPDRGARPEPSNRNRRSGGCRAARAAAWPPAPRSRRADFGAAGAKEGAPLLLSTSAHAASACAAAPASHALLAPGARRSTRAACDRAAARAARRRRRRASWWPRWWTPTAWSRSCCAWAAWTRAWPRRTRR